MKRMYIRKVDSENPNDMFFKKVPDATVEILIDALRVKLATTQVMHQSTRDHIEWLIKDLEAE